MFEKGISLSFGDFLLKQFSVEGNVEQLFKDHQKKLKKEYEERVKNSKPSIDDINHIVSSYFGIDPEAIKMPRDRRRIVVYPRQIVHYICIKILDYKLREVGEFYNGMTHCNVYYSTKTVENMCDTDARYKEHVKKLIEITKTELNHGKEIKGINSERES